MRRNTLALQNTIHRRRADLLTLAALAAAFCLPVHPCCGQAAPPTQSVIVDTDVADDIDDAYALALIANAPGVKLLGVTTTWGEAGKRAQVTAKLLAAFGRPDVPVYAGRAGVAHIGRQYDWARGYHSPAIKSGEAVLFLKSQIDKAPRQITLIGIGPLVNLGDLLTRYPEVKPKIRRIVLMAGSVYVGYNGQTPAVPEYNVYCDPAAARVVYSSGVPLVMAGLEVTTMMHLDVERQKRLGADGTWGTDALAALTLLWGGTTPTLFDAVAVAYALGHGFCDEERDHVVVDDNGLTRITAGPPNVTVLIHPRPDEFLDWYVSTVRAQAAGPEKNKTPRVNH